MNYYLKILGPNGENWTKIEGFDFDFFNNVSKGPGGLNQSTDPEFGQINVGLTNSTFGPSFLKLLSGDLPCDIVIRATMDDPLGVQTLGLPTYDLQLNDVTVNRLQATQYASPLLQLSYTDIAIKTYDLTDTNSSVPSPDPVFDWDVTNNDTTPTDLPTFPAFTPLNNPNQPTQFVMAINGLSGDSSVAGRLGWFTLQDFDLDLGADPSSKGIGAQGFSVYVEGMTGLTALMVRAAGNVLSNTITVASIDPGPATVKYQFADAQIESVIDDGNQGFRIDFSFEKIVTTTTGLDSKGNVLTEVAGYDLVSGKDLTSLKDAEPTKANVIAGEASEYYLALSGFRGESVDLGHEGWFRLDQMSFGVDGFGAFPEFGDLFVSLSTDTGIAQMLARMSAVSPSIKGATIHGIDARGNTVYGLDLAGVQIAGLDDFSGGGMGLSLDFTKVEVTTFGYDPNDVLTSAGKFSWDLDNIKPLPNGVISAIPLASKTPITPTVAEKYFMIVDGMNGGVTSAGYTRAFELSDFGFTAFDDGGPGTQFNNVFLQTNSDIGLWSMLRAAHAGNQISGARIVGVVDVGGKLTQVSSLLLQDLQVASVQEGAGPGFRLELDYDRFTMRTFDPLTNAQTAVTGYDRSTDTAFTGTTTIKTSTNLPEAQATDFFFGMGAVKGGSGLANFKGTARIVDFGFDVTLPTFEGTQVGQSELGRLTLDFANDTTLTSMLSLMNKGTVVEGASLFGLADLLSTGALTQVSELALKDILVTRVTDFAGAGFRVELDFAAYSLVQDRQDPATGQLKGKSTFGWDDIANTTNPTVKGSHGSDGPLVDVSPTNYYLALQGVLGDLTGTAHGGWFKMNDLLFSSESSKSIGDGVSPNVGGVQNAIFTLNLTSDRGLTQLMEALATGAPLAAAQIEGTADIDRNGKPFEATVLAYTLNEVYVTNIAENADRGYSVTFEVARYGAETFDATGKSLTETFKNLEPDDPATSISAFNITGLAGNDTIAGTTNKDVMDGQGGNDILLGNGGNDSLIGGLGNDSLNGGLGLDTLNGGNNNDTLRGGAGIDLLTGAAGSDTFVFSLGSSGGAGFIPDTISDFVRGEDKIDLTELSFGVLTFITGFFLDSNEVRVETISGGAMVSVNLTGNIVNSEVDIAVLYDTSTGALTASDFLL